MCFSGNTESKVWRDTEDGAQNRGGMRDTRKIEDELRDENHLGGIGMRSFHDQLVACGIVLKLIAGCGINSK